MTIYINFLFRQSWAFYRMSYLWYTVTGALVTMSVALVVSLLLPCKTDKLDPVLLAPFIRKYLKKNNSLELCHVQVTKHDEKIITSTTTS